MTLDQPPPSRFGAATPGVRPAMPSLEPLLTTSLARPPRRRLTRRRVLAAAGVLALAAGGYVAGHFTWPPPPPPALSRLAVTAAALPAGSRLSSADLRVVTVARDASVPRGALSPAAAVGLLGKVVRDAIPAGTFLKRGLVAPGGAVPGPLQALVGLALKPGQLPAGGLAVGQQVRVVVLRPNAQGTSAIPAALVVTTVWSLRGPDSSGITQAVVVVPAAVATDLAGFAAQGNVVLVATALTPAARRVPASTTAPSTTASAKATAKTSRPPGKPGRTKPRRTKPGRTKPGRTVGRKATR